MEEQPRVRAFRPEDEADVTRIFEEGMREMITDTAFRGLSRHPESLLLYSAITVGCVSFTSCWLLIGLLPVALLCARYFYSRRVIHEKLRRATSHNKYQAYIYTTGSGLWVAELSGAVVGVVAAAPPQGALRGAVELQRMSVDRRYRRSGVGVALGLKVKEFGASCGYSSVVLGTTAYTPAPHRLYRRLGFRHQGVTNGYVSPDAKSKSSLLQRIFYRVHFHHYVLDLQNPDGQQGGLPPHGLLLQGQESSSRDRSPPPGTGVLLQGQESTMTSLEINKSREGGVRE